MKVGYIQFEPVFGNKERNIKVVLEWLRIGVDQGFDLIVLPELCTTGYAFRNKGEVTKVSEDIPDGQFTRRLVGFAKENNVHIVAGLCEREGEQYYNSAVFVGSSDYIGKYRKAHLFNSEKLWFSRGTDGFAVYDTSLARIGIMICFDWFFPEVSRILALKGAQIICHPANLVLPYCQKAMLGVAVQNRVFVITANRVGKERGIKFTGKSQIVDPNMHILSKSGINKEELKIVNIDPKIAENKWITKKNNLWSDRRVELYDFLVN